MNREFFVCMDQLKTLRANYPRLTRIVGPGIHVLKRPRARARDLSCLAISVNRSGLPRTASLQGLQGVVECVLCGQRSDPQHPSSLDANSTAVASKDSKFDFISIRVVVGRSGGEFVHVADAPSP